MIYLRTPEEKADPVAWWQRPDEVFFAAGACHILASVYIAMHPEFSALMIKPLGGHCGGHVVAVHGDDLFDASGLKAKAPYIQGYLAEMRSRFDGWDADLVELREDPAGSKFCEQHGYRCLAQFPGPVRARARKFVGRRTSGV